jgi:hypothetical protein
LKLIMVWVLSVTDTDTRALSLACSRRTTTCRQMRSSAAPTTPSASTRLLAR